MAKEVLKWNGYRLCFHVIENEALLSSLLCEDKKKIGISSLAHPIPKKFSFLPFICFHKTPQRIVHLIAVSDTRVCKREEKEHSNVCVANRYHGINEVCVIVSGAGTINMST